MTGWWRTRQVPAVLVGILVLGVLTGILGRVRLSLPSLVGSSNELLLTTLLPIGWAVLIAHSLVPRRTPIEVRPIGPLGALDAAWFSSTTATVAVVFSLASRQGLTRMGAVLVLAGLAVLGTMLLDARRAVLITTCFVIVTTFYGAGAPGSGFVRVVQEDGNLWWSGCLGTLVCLAANVILVSGSPTAIPEPPS